MEKYFNIRYEFSRQAVFAAVDEALEQGRPGYICVADGNVLTMVHKDSRYARVVDGAMFSICDSSYVPLYLKRLYGIKRSQFCGSDIFSSVVGMKKYRQFFLGGSSEVLQALKREQAKVDPAIAGMTFLELPFCNVEDFDYEGIAEAVNADGADIIWVALGAPKQERFMQLLQPHLKRGVMIGVGAVFNFFCGLENAPRRAPEWMLKMHIEFVWRIFSEPRKQLRRCRDILFTLPSILREEKRRRADRVCVTQDIKKRNK